MLPDIWTNNIFIIFKHLLADRNESLEVVKMGEKEREREREGLS